MKTTLLAIVTSVGWVLFPVSAETAEGRPNILLILADNWSWPHAGILGDPTVKTPSFDRLAREGTLFTNAFCPVPSCSPTRASLLTGRAAHQLEVAANLMSSFPMKFRVYPELLRDAGYTVGYTAKGWGPGNYEVSERSENPAGPSFGPKRYGLGQGPDPAAEQDRTQFQGLEDFLRQRPADKPFCFWHGFTHPSRPTWVEGSGEQSGLDLASVRVPDCLPDVPEVRGSLLDYYASIVRLDALIGRSLDLLAKDGLLDSTLIVCCADNGWQMPRGLANVYDTGCRVPFVVRWPGHVLAGRTVEDFISLTDLAPTFLEAAGLTPLPEMTGRSLFGLITGAAGTENRDAVFLERERHANVREGDAGYPIRAIRTRDFLYVHNLRPDRWPAGDPVLWYAVGDFGDVDPSAAKQFVLDHRDDPQVRRYFELSFAKRPAEELYDLRRDPGQIANVAADPAYADALRRLRARLDDWRRTTADPRLENDDDTFDRYPYLNRPVQGARGAR